MSEPPRDIIVDDEAMLGLKELREGLIPELLVNAFEVLLELAPAEEALKAIRPHMRRLGATFASEPGWPLRREGAEDAAVASVARLFHACRSAFSREGCPPPVLLDGCAQGEVPYCPVAKAGPEVCGAFSLSLAEGICEAIGPGCEVVFTRAIAGGDASCSYVVRKMGDGLAASAESGDALEISSIAMEPEEQAALRTRLEAGCLAALTRAAEDLGVADDFLERVKPPDAAAGKQLGLFLVNERNGSLAGLEGIRDAMAVCKRAICQAGPCVSKRGKLEGEVTSCPFESGPPQACAQLEAEMNGFCQAIDRSYEFSYRSMRTQGDISCSWRVSRKRAKAPKGGGGKRSAASSDEAKLDRLSRQLAEGEITEEELDRKVAKVLERYFGP